MTETYFDTSSKCAELFHKKEIGMQKLMYVMDATKRGKEVSVRKSFLLDTSTTDEEVEGK